MLKGILCTALLLSTVSAFAADSALPGETIYKAKCAGCHNPKDGPAGTGNPNMAKLLKVDQEKLNLTTLDAAKDSDTLIIIAKGKEKMPAFGAKLSSDEQKQVLEYIQKNLHKK